jgi:hypothetical protein
MLHSFNYLLTYYIDLFLNSFPYLIANFLYFLRLMLLFLDLNYYHLNLYFRWEALVNFIRIILFLFQISCCFQDQGMVSVIIYCFNSVKEKNYHFIKIKFQVWMYLYIRFVV